MIHVVELPLHAKPRVWFAYGDDDLERKVLADDPLQAWEVHDEVSAQELLEAAGHAEVTLAVRAQFPALCQLGDQHGWQTPLYRADHLLGRGMLRAQPVSLRQALLAALGARGHPCRIYWTDSEAVAASEGSDPQLGERQQWRARHALHEQLVALEVVADDS